MKKIKLEIKTFEHRIHLCHQDCMGNAWAMSNLLNPALCLFFHKERELNEDGWYYRCDACKESEVREKWKRRSY